MGALKAKGFAAFQREKLLAAYETHGPLTDHEMEAETEIDRSSVCARRNELIRLGHVEKDDGRVRLNPTTGVNNTLWRLKAQR